MTRIVSPASKPGRPGKLAAALTLSAILVLGPLVATSTAEQWDRPTWNNKNQPQSNRESGSSVNRNKNSANHDSGNSNNNLANPKNWKKGVTGIPASPF